LTLYAFPVHPIAFHLGPLTVHWYGILLATAFLLGLWTAARRAPRTGIAPEKISDIGLWLIIGAVIGARGLYIVSYWRESFAGQPFWEIFMIQRGGLVYYGGLIGASLACIIYCRRHKLALWKVADVLTPSIALGYVFGRIGCLMNGCCFGRACELPWAIRFPADHSTGGTPLHPTQIYDSLLSFALYAGLAWLYRHKKFDGQVFVTYLLCYAITRSIVEAFRGDYSEVHRHAGLTPAHLVSIGIFVTGLALFFFLRQRAAKS
jgi:phosphatidylglycerol:prolipoprotein diacylglycerol transferase